MFKSVDQFEILRANEYARISRWIRESETGWLFYDHRGCAHSIGAQEAAALEGAAQRMLERYLSRVKQMPRRIILAAFATTAWHLVAGALLPPGFAWLVPLTIAPFAAFFLFEATADLRFRTSQRRWQKAWAQKFRFRPSVSPAIAARHRRYNLFRLGSYMFACLALGHVGWRTITLNPEQAISPTTLLLIALAWLLFIPANRVDATHRRRKSLG